MTERPLDYLFDIGNVILHFDFSLFARAVEADCDNDAAGLLALIVSMRDDLEGRKMDRDEFLDFAIRKIRYRGKREQFVRAWQHIFTENEPIIRWIEELDASGARLFLLSNTNQLHVDYFMAEYPVFSRFDGWVFSHEAGLSKPSPAIYHHAIQKLGLDPARTVYVDDLEANADTGRALGFRTVHYTGQPVSEFVI